MKQYILIAIISLCALSIFAQSTDQNFIKTTTITNASGTEKIEQIVYFDGLGRPVQTVQRGITPTWQDLVSLTEYDAFGREYRQWLPLPEAANRGEFVRSDLFRQDARTHYGDNNPFAEIIYEQSPLSRVLGNKNPGAAWHAKPTGIRHEINTVADNVKHFFIDADHLTKGVNYAPGTLYKTTTIDEDGKRAVQFTDKLGRTVMTRQINWSQNHDTYYVYDNFNNLRYILPPLAADAFNAAGHGIPEDDPALLNYAYTYKYDARNRQIKKRLPGADWIEYVYDRADRLILSQDGNQRAQVDNQQRRKWTVYKYDTHGRILYTGELTAGGNADSLRDYFKDKLVIERYEPAYQWIADNSGYTRDFFHNPHPMTLLTVNYYDTYDFLDLPAHSTWKNNLTYQTKSGFDSRFNNTHGLLTGTRTYILDGSNTYLLTVLYYDYRGRVVQTRATNHVGGFDINYTAYTFTGNLTQSLSEHSTNAQHSNPLTELYQFTYDHAGRLLETIYTYQHNDPIVLSANMYDELGRLKSRTRHNSTDTESYQYNIRNWTTQIKSGEFVQNLYYNTLPPMLSWHEPMFNGNIAANTWKYNGELNGYWYYYDGLNRLTIAYSILNDILQADPMSETFWYDKHGNIIWLNRWDRYNGTVDELGMTYKGNQLMRIDDWATWHNPSYDLKEYHDLNTVGNDFAYDKNGNMIKDLDRDIVTIQYNFLNLPTLIQFKKGHQIMNIYAADGRKLETQYRTVRHNVNIPAVNIGETANLNNSNSHLDGTIYAGNKEYKYSWMRFVDWQPTRIHNPEGYISFNPMNGADTQAGWSSDWYNYYRRDHLGNVREVWRAPYYHTTLIDHDENWLPIWANLPICGYTVQRVQYYPSGLPWPNTQRGGRMYQEKEWIEMHGYDNYDFHWRHYYPAIARTTTPDPMAELFPHVSPYSWVLNNFPNKIDPDGRIVRNAHEEDLERRRGELATARERANEARTNASNSPDDKGARREASRATRAENRAERAFNNVQRDFNAVQGAIDDMRTNMPEQFAILDNLQYTDARGNVRTLDVSVRRGDLPRNVENGMTTYTVNEVTGIIRSGTTDNTIHTVTVTLNRGYFPNTTLPHEGGHAVTIAEDPIRYRDWHRASPNHNCQDPRNANHPMSIRALEWQRIRSGIRR